VIPGVRSVDLSGPGHCGYLFGERDDAVFFWGDIVHCHVVQLRRPSVSAGTDTDESAAVATGRKALQLTPSNKWRVGAAHLPFPGLGHVRRDPDRYTWVPISYAPVAESSTESPAPLYRP
jgi:hypothetical protein